MTGWLSVKKAAAYLDVSYSQFRALVAAGAIRPDGMVGARRRFAPASLDRWMRYQRDEAVRLRRVG